MSVTDCRRSASCGVVDMFLPSKRFSTASTAFRPQPHSFQTELRETSTMQNQSDQTGRPTSPGLKWRKRKRGPDVPYWFADPEAIKAGYPVKSTNLNEDVDRPKILVDRAERLQSEMLKWMSGERKRELCFDGSFKSLIDIYERDPESSYRELKPGPRETYDVYIKRLRKHIGELRVQRSDGTDVKRWFKIWRTDPDGSDHLPRARMALSVLKAAVTHGVIKRFAGCEA